MGRLHDDGDRRCLTADTLGRPYDRATFAAQLAAAGVPHAAIAAIATDASDGRTADRLRWLYDDIDSGEAEIVDGERRSQIVGVFVTDGLRVLVERGLELSAHGEAFKLGGQLGMGESPRDAAAREVAEETPIVVGPASLVELCTLDDVTTDSPKLPGVPARKRIAYFLLHVASFDDIEPFTIAPYRGGDGCLHELLLLPLEEATRDLRVKAAYRTTLSRCLDRIKRSANEPLASGGP